MPIINSIRRISPLDLNKNIKIGVAFPLDERNLFSGTETVQEQVKTNLINVLLTEKGERIFLPDYGVGLKNYLFEPDIDVDSLNQIVSSQINIYVPEISLTNTDINFVRDEHLLYVRLFYRIIHDNTEDSIQLNFRENGI